MKINTLRDFEWVEPEQVVAGTGTPRSYSIAATRSFYSDGIGGFVQYDQRSRYGVEVQLRNLKEMGLNVRPSTLLEEHDLAARRPEGSETYSDFPGFPNLFSLILDGLVVPQHFIVDCGNVIGLPHIYIDFSEAKKGISREEAVEGKRARRNLFLRNPKIDPIRNKHGTLDGYLIVPEGVYPLNFSLTEPAMFRRDQISRETGFIESTSPIPSREDPNLFSFGPRNTMLSYPILMDGCVGLHNDFSNLGHALGVRLASDEDIRPTIKKSVEKGEIKEVVVVRKEERFLELVEAI